MPTPPEPPSEHREARIEQALFDARTVLIFGEITSELAERVTRRVLALTEAGDGPIRVLINSPGGHVESGDTLFDLLRFIAPKVIMIGTGWVSSAGALIYCAADKENRLALPNTRFLLHEPSGGMRGQASDVEIEVRQILRMRQRLTHIFADATGRDPARIAEDTERNHWMSAREAIEYGLVSRIVTSENQLPPET